MCGRFTQSAPWEKVKKEFVVKASESNLFKPRYNIAPMQIVPVVRDSVSERIISELKWGLVPSWAKDSEMGNRMINARAETLTEKPSFREAFRKRRCLIPTSGFYEWKKTGSGAKQPFYFYLKEKDIFGFAGLWEEWLDKESGELLETFTIITTEANDVLKPVHDRMPVIIKAENYDEWLDPKVKDNEQFEKLLAPYPANEMDSHPVSKAVNSPNEDSPELIINSK
ncbi:MAG: SOS response-associated peptidase [Acidobacteriota bacterium]|nr:SOS response-associated peptidase [Acidobacteriota bacterium]